MTYVQVSNKAKSVRQECGSVKTRLELKVKLSPSRLPNIPAQAQAPDGSAWFFDMV